MRSPPYNKLLDRETLLSLALGTVARPVTFNVILSKMPSRYLAITQEPYCCVPTTLLMILLRRGLPLMQIADIGYELGLAVPEQAGHLFPGARIGVRPSSGFGTEVQ